MELNSSGDTFIILEDIWFSSVSQITFRDCSLKQATTTYFPVHSVDPAQLEREFIQRNFIHKQQKLFLFLVDYLTMLSRPRLHCVGWQDD
jgi:hypothetical protein